MASMTKIKEIDRYEVGRVLVAIDRVKNGDIVTFEVTLSVNGLIKFNDVYCTKAEAMQGASELLVEIMDRDSATQSAS